MNYSAFFKWLFMEFGVENRYGFAADEHPFVSNSYAHYATAFGYLMAQQFIFV